MYTSFFNLSLIHLAKRLNETKIENNPEPKISNSDMVFAYIELLCQGKNDFDHIREMHIDPDFYCKTLDTETYPPVRLYRKLFIKDSGNI